MELTQQVFISYSSKDEQVANQICEQLESRSIRCWIAPRDIQPGSNWAGSIMKAIKSSKVLLLLLTKDSNVSEQVMREVERAVNLRLRIICLRLENIKLSDHLEYFISAVQGVAAFDEPLEKILEALYENIKQLLPANSALAATPMQAIAEAKPTHDNAKQLEEANQAYKNKNYQKAFVLYSLLAEQGHTDAQFSLGRMYDHGEGVSHDTGQAVQWYRKAAEQGNAKAQFNLGVMYANGEGVNKDKVKTFQWYRKAAEQGYTNAQFNLGWMYEKGDGVSQAKEQAIYWYKKAAEQGDTDAQNRLTYLSKQP